MAEFQRLRQAAQPGLHLGCGSKYIVGLVNVDLHDDSVRDEAWDVLSLPLTDHSVDWVEAHHVLEHLGRQEGELALREWRRVLRREGRLAITVPDLQLLAWRQVMTTREQRTTAMFYGSQEHAGMFHRYGYTSQSLAQTLKFVGFSQVRVHRLFPATRPTPSLLALAR